YTAPTAVSGSDTVRATSGGVVGTAAVTVTTAAPAPSDAGFEALAVGTGTFAAFQYAPAGTPWTFAGAAGVAGNGSGFTTGNPTAAATGSTAVGTAAVPVPAAAPGPSDAGFEAPAVGTGTYATFQYGPAGTPWTYAGAAGVAGNSSGFTTGNPPAPEGVQVAF